MINHCLLFQNYFGFEQISKTELCGEIEQMLCPVGPAVNDVRALNRTQNTDVTDAQHCLMMVSVEAYQTKVKSDYLILILTPREALLTWTIMPRGVLVYFQIVS